MRNSNRKKKKRSKKTPNIQDIVTLAKTYSHWWARGVSQCLHQRNQILLSWMTPLYPKPADGLAFTMKTWRKGACHCWVVGAGMGVSQAPKEDLWSCPLCCGAGDMSAPGMLMEFHQISPWWQSHQEGSEISRSQETGGRRRILWGTLLHGVLPEGSKRDDAQDMAAQIPQGLTVCPGVLQTLCLNTWLSLETPSEANPWEYF